MLAGEPPFTGGTPQAVIAKHMQAKIQPLRVVRPAVSRSLQDVVSKALAKVPADRYASGQDLGRALLAVTANDAPPAWRRALVIGIPAAIALAALVLAVVLVRRPTSSAPPAPAGSVLERPRIAVMYFDDMSGNPSLRNLADDVTEELIYELSGVNGFQVISRNAMQPYRGRELPLEGMVARLKAQLVVDGSVQRWRDGVRLRVQLIDASTDTYLDSLSVERSVADTLAFVQAAAQEIAADLRQAIGREVRLQDAGLGTGNPVARELARKAQRAREDARVIADSPHPEDVSVALEALRRADSLLALAQAADTGWYRSWIARGWVAADRAALLGGDRRLAALEDGLRLAGEAVRRAPDSADALELRGTLRGRLVGETQTAAEGDRAREAEADLRAALDRDSTLVRAWATLGYILWSKGSITEAALASRRALREDTYLTAARGTYNELFFDDLMLANFPQAAEWCRRGRATYPADWRFVECELTLLRHDLDRTPDADSAWQLVRVLDRMDPPERTRSEGRTYHSIYRRIVAATISARAGRPEVARAEIARARQATRGDSTLAIDLDYDEAVLRLALGERQRAAGLLRAYVAARPLARDQLARDPLLRGLPSDR
jgi:TolB-like protein